MNTGFLLLLKSKRNLIKLVCLRQKRSFCAPSREKTPHTARHANRAITGGSRGIADYPAVMRAAVRYIKACGAVPFIVPAMGSHGGATAEGQVEVLKHLGITGRDRGCSNLFKYGCR